MTNYPGGPQNDVVHTMTTTPDPATYTFTLEDDDVQAIYAELRIGRTGWYSEVARDSTKNHVIRELAIIANRNGLSILTQPILDVQFYKIGLGKLGDPNDFRAEDEDWDMANVYITALARPYITEGK